MSIQYKKPFDMIAKLPKNADFRNWWTVPESNRRSPQCECGALPTELTARTTKRSPQSRIITKSDLLHPQSQKCVQVGWECPKLFSPLSI